MASALDDLLADFSDNAGSMPAVNPPESSKVLSAQTTPEVAGEPEPEPVDATPPPPTEKPAAVVAAEAAKKTRAPRGSKKADAPATAPDGWDNTPAPGADGKLTTEQLVAELRDRGYTVTLVAG